MYVRILKASSAKHLRKPFHLMPEINNLFIDLLADCLKSNGHTVRESIGDADVDIIPSVLDIACGGKNVILVGPDTDLLILLLCR